MQYDYLVVGAGLFGAIMIKIVLQMASYIMKAQKVILS